MYKGFSSFPTSSNFGAQSLVPFFFYLNHILGKPMQAHGFNFHLYDD